MLRIIRFALIISGLAGWLAGGDQLVWQPPEPVLSSANVAGNWITQGGIEPRATVLLGDELLRWSAQGDVDCAIAADLTCAEVFSEAAGFGKTIFLGSGPAPAGTPSTLTITATTRIFDANVDWVSDVAKGTGGRIVVRGGGSHDFTRATFLNTSFGRFQVEGASTTLTVPAGANPTVSLDDTQVRLLGGQSNFAGLDYGPSGSGEIAVNGTCRADTADLRPGDLTTGTADLRMSVFGFLAGQASRFEVAGQLALQPGRSRLIVVLPSSLAVGGTVIGAIRFGSLLAGQFYGALDVVTVGNSAFTASAVVDVAKGQADLVISAVGAAALDTNLIVNPGAEAGAAAANENVIVAIPAWTTGTGTPTVIAYGNGGFPAVDSPGPVNRGKQFFAGGNVAFSTLTQDVDLSALAAIIDQGQTRAELSGFLGGFLAQDDRAVVNADLRNAAGATVATLTIGAVTAADRGNVTGLLLRSAEAAIPAGVRSARVTLSMTRAEGSSNDGYADEISFVVRPGKPQVSFSATALTVAEGASATIDLVLSRASTETVNVFLGSSIDGTAQAGLSLETIETGDDVTVIPAGNAQPLQFAPGQTRITVTVTALADAVVETDETQVIRIAEVSGSGGFAGSVDVGANSFFVVTIPAQAAAAVIPVASFDATSVCLLEGETRTATVRLDQATTVPVTVQLTQEFADARNNNAVTGQSLTAIDTGDDAAISASTLVFQPGETVKTVTITAVDDGFGGEIQEGDEDLILVISPDSQGVTIGVINRFTATVVGQETQIDVVLDGQLSGQELLSASAGQTFAVRIFDGIPPYRVTTAANVRFVPDGLRCDQNLDTLQEDSDLDPSQFFLVSVIAAGVATDFTVTDAAGASISPILINIGDGVLSPGPSEVAIIQPALPTIGDLTLYTAVCPGTEEGLAQLKAFLVGKDATQVRAFAWDATAQAYVQLPQEPVGGLTPAHAVFIATRDPVTFNFTGTQSPLPFTLLLRPGFNFVGIPPLADAGRTLTSHTTDDLRLLTLDETPIEPQAARDAIVGVGANGEPVAFLWNGVAYAEVTVINSGQGVWIKNQSSDSVLVRRDVGLPPLTKAASAGMPTSVRKLGDPPPPPTNAAARATSGGGGCGHGSGFAALALGLIGLSLALRRWR